MPMNLTKFALKRPVTMLLIILAIAVFGLLAISHASMELIPDIEMPMQIVMTTYPGADPESIEELISKPIEDAGAALSGVDTIASYSYANYSMVMFSYDFDVDINEAYIDLRAALDMVSASLPADAGDPTILQLSVNQMPTVVLAVVNQGDGDLLSYVEDTVQPELESISGAAQVSIAGGEKTYIRVQLDEEAMNQYGLTMSGVSNFISAMDFQIPAGSVDAGNQELNVSSSGDITSLAEVASIPVITSRGSVITLDDVAEVTWGAKPTSSISRYNGDDCVLITVTKRQASSTVSTAKDIIRTVEQLTTDNDSVKIMVSYDGSDIIMQALGSIAQSLGLGVLFAMLVLYLFFGDFKASLIVGSSMPLSILGTLALMDLLNFSLNVVTAMAMIISIGMIVDCAIVVIESCFRFKEDQDAEALNILSYDAKSMEAYSTASERGTGFVMTSITASTITTICVFLPMMTANSMASQMYGEFIWIITFTMLLSLLTSLTVVPLCFRTFRPVAKHHIPVNRWVQRIAAWYDRFMHKAIHKKKLIVAIAVVLFVLSAGLLTTMNLELIPTTDEGHMQITATFRPGTSLEHIDESVVFIEDMIKADETFDSYDMTVSEGSASFTAYRADGNKRKSAESVAIYNEALSNVTSMDLNIQAYSTYSMFSAMMTSASVTLESTDIDALHKAGLMLEDAVLDIPGVIRVSSDASSAATAIAIHVDPLLSMSYGLTAVQVAADLYNTLSGLTSATVTSNGEEYDIILEYPEGAYADIWSVMNKTIPTSYGTFITLDEIADVEYSEEMQMRSRTNGLYQLTVTAATQDGMAFDVADQMTALMDTLPLPAAVHEVDGMMDVMMNESLSEMARAIFTAMFLVFLVMAMQFESIRYSLMVMMSIPFSLIGSFLLLRLTGDNLSMISLMGFLMLVGIVVNNGILLVDTANRLREQGLAREEALIQSGKLRLRPILMTTLTTVLGMLPMAFATGTAAMLRGMAIVIIGGLLASTVLILVMMPSFYLIIDKNPNKKKKKQLPPETIGVIEN